MARQWLIPGYGNINETGQENYIVPGYGQFNENQPIVVLVEQWHPSYGGGGIGKAQIVPSGESPPISN
ncbi:MAG: hypothetical protein ACW987_14855 [Candidatus Thorarchaeota archaeon]|jgi:hypothetical protein